MANVVFGVWDGEVYDHRGPRADSAGLPAAGLPGLEGFDVFNEGNPIRAFLGDRGFFIFDKRVSLIDAFWHYMDKAAEQSCGKCTPCRIGTVLVRDALNAMRHGDHSDLGLDGIV